MQELVSQSPEGEIIMLPIPPDCVNVQLLEHTTWNPNDIIHSQEEANCQV